MKDFYKLILSFIAVTLAVNLAAQVPDMMYFKFDQAGSTTCLNEGTAPVGNVNSPIVGNLTQGSTGLCGSALVGTGSSSASNYVNTGWSTSLSGSWTLSFWTSNITPSSTLWYILGDNNAGGFRCFTNGVAGANNWILRGPFTDVLITGGATVAPHMNTFVYDASASEIRAYLDGALVNTVSQSPITISGTGPFKIGAYASSSGLSGNMDEFRLYSYALTPAEVAATYSGCLNAEVNEFPYCEGFEDGEGQWEHAGIQSSWEHGAPAGTFISSAAQGSNAWVTNLDGDHNNDEFSFVRSPKFDLSSLVDPTFSAEVIHELQNNSDGVAIQYSTDSMSTWTTLGSSSSPGSWYNSNNIGVLAFFGNTNGFTNNQSSWTNVSHSLSSISVDTSVFFRFVMATNGSNTNEGFGFDHIVVAESDDIEYVELLAPDSSCGSSATEVSAVLCNKSVIPQTGFSIVLDTGGINITTVINDTIPICGCDTFSILTTSTTNGANWNLASWVVNTGDVNANNDSAFTDALIYPIPTGDVTGGGNYCQGDVAQLTFTFNGTQPFNLSFTDGSNGTFIPGIDSNAYVYTTFTGGSFEIIALSDASGCPGDTGAFGGVANVVFNPAPAVDLGPDSTVCSGYVLDAGAGQASYAWNTGATTQTITPSQTGTYTVTVTDNNGCDNSDEIELEVNPSPVVNLEDTVLCEGNSFSFNAGGGYQSYLWDDGSTGQVRVVNSLTTVFVTVTDFQGCEGTATASITSVVPNPTPNVQNQSGLAPITLDAGAGFSSYLWVTGATTQTIDVFTSGTYSVTVTDDSGCEGEDEGKATVWPNGVKDLTLDDNGVAVFPNPTSDFVNIVAVDQRGSIEAELKDMNGKIVVSEALNENLDEQFKLQLPQGLSAGQYIITVKDGNGTVISRQKLMIR